jgi:hypothetical protein
VVLETPESSPSGDFPHLRKAGPLAWFYRYDLISPMSAEGFPARWALLRFEQTPSPPQLVTLLRYEQGTLPHCAGPGNNERRSG